MIVVESGSNEKQLEEHLKHYRRFREYISGYQSRSGLYLDQSPSPEDRARILTKTIWEHGVATECDDHRRSLLHGLGIIRSRAAEHGMMFGCMLFGMPLQCAAQAKLFDRLGIKFTFIKAPEGREYCCGWPVVERAITVDDRVKAEEEAKKWVGENIRHLKALGAKKITYACTWCAYMAKYYFPEEADSQFQHIDVLLERLEKEPLRLRQPTVIAYYEGCHARNKHLAPGARLNWEPYKELLYRIDGLTVVEMPHNMCCVFNKERLIQDAIDKKVSAIVCTCAPCWTWLDRASRGRMPIKMIQEVVLEALPA